MVKEDFQGIGIGNFLCDTLIQAARQHGIRQLYAYVAQTNGVMLKIFKNHNFTVKPSSEVDGYYVKLDLESEQVLPGQKTHNAS